MAADTKIDILRDARARMSGRIAIMEQDFLVNDLKEFAYVRLKISEARKALEDALVWIEKEIRFLGEK